MECILNYGGRAMFLCEVHMNLMYHMLFSPKGSVLDRGLKQLVASSFLMKIVKLSSS